jgi:hypothetical protein
VINHVKYDKKAQFEQLVYEIFRPSASNLNQKAQRAFDSTRVLNPAQPEEDGTFTNMFLMDPPISGEDYWIDNILEKMYPKAQAEEYYMLFQESLARERTIHAHLVEVLRRKL